MAKPSTGKKTLTQSKAIPAPKIRGPVKHVRAKAGHTVKVARLPKGSKERKVVETLGANEGPAWVQAMRKYGFSR